MAKKSQNRGQIREVKKTQPETEPQEQGAQIMGDTNVTLTKRNVQKNGIVTYSREGVNASVYFNKSMFNGEPPETVEVGASNLRAPGEGGVGGGRSADPAKLAERAAKAQAAAEKAAARAAKSLEKANKLAARVSGTAAPAAEAQ